MRLELAWRDGVSLLVEMPRRVPLDAFLARVAQVEALIGRVRVVQAAKPRAEPAEPDAPLSEEERHLVQEFLRFRQSRAPERGIEERIARLEEGVDRALQLLKKLR